MASPDAAYARSGAAPLYARALQIQQEVLRATEDVERVEAAWRKTLSYRLRGQLEAPEQWKMQHLIAESRRVWNLQKVMAASRIWEERDKVGSMKGPMRKRKENAGGRVGKLSGWDRVTTPTLPPLGRSWPVLAVFDNL